MTKLLILVAILAATPLGVATLSDAAQDDAGTGGDAGDSFDAATELPAKPAGRYSGQMVVLDDPQDWYAFTTTAPEGTVNLTLTFQGASTTCGPTRDVSLGSITAALYDPAGRLADSRTARGPCGVQVLLSAASAEPGTWRVGLAYGGESLPAGLPIHAHPDGQGASAIASYDLTLGCKPWC